MPVVMVDLEDLETIVFATAAIKTIEGALASRKSDPFVRPHLDYTTAHDRLATAMRNARRAEAGTVIGWDEPLTAYEVEALRKLNTMWDEKERDYITPKERLENKAIDTLMAKGCLVLGQLVTGVVWSGDTAASVTPSPKGFAFKVTSRGEAKLEEAEKKEKVND